jgi:hypothetical protein
MPFENSLWLHQVCHRFATTHSKLLTTARETESRREPRSRLFLLPDTFFVEGELTSNGHQLTSQGGSIAEESRDKDQRIKNDLLPESQKSAELPTEILDRFHDQR